MQHENGNDAASMQPSSLHPMRSDEVGEVAQEYDENDENPGSKSASHKRSTGLQHPFVKNNKRPRRGDVRACNASPPHSLPTNVVTYVGVKTPLFPTLFITTCGFSVVTQQTTLGLRMKT